MLEQIALSISTAIFFLCTVIVSSILPSPSVKTDVPEEPAVFASADVGDESSISLVGKWNGGGSCFEFTDTGRLIYNGTESAYSLSGDKLKVNTVAGGRSREYTVTVEVIDGRNIILGGIPLHRAEN